MCKMEIRNENGGWVVAEVGSFPLIGRVFSMLGAGGFLLQVCYPPPSSRWGSFSPQRWGGGSHHNSMQILTLPAGPYLGCM